MKKLFSYSKRGVSILTILSVVITISMPFALYPSTAKAVSQVTFDSSGTFTVPSDVTSITVEAWGGGSGGGQGTGDGHRGGGGGGAYTNSTITVTPNSLHNVVVGLGAAPGNGSASDAGDSYFDTGLQVLADGGRASTGGTNGGDGGKASESVGTVKFSGGKGGDRASGGGNDGGGGGGGSATPLNNGSNGANGSGDNGGLGGVGQGNGGKGGNDNQVGQNGVSPGGGGGGRGEDGGTSGTGANGRIIISYTPTITTGTIIVKKVMIGGTNNFIFTGSPSGSISTNEGTISSTLTAGTYTSTETLVSGWDLTSVISDDSDSIGSVVDHKAEFHIVAGETVTCTFTNTKKGSITVVKNVAAPDGETDVNDNHTFKVKLDDGTEDNFSENSPKTYENVLPGSHTITEIIGDPDFDLLRITNNNTDQVVTDSNSINFDVPAGQNIDITITNKQKQGTITVNKTVDNSHGLGDAVPENFSFQINDGDVIPFEEDGQNVVNVDPGTYTVIESNSFGYAVEYNSCSSIVISSNENATCNITNHDLEPGKGAITVIKVITKDNGGTAEVGDFTLQITSSEDNPMEVDSGEVSQLEPGAYMVDEVIPENLENAYTQTSILCTDNGEEMNGNIIELEDGHVYQCIITNDDQPGTLIVKKVVTTDNGGTKTASDFSFQVNEDEPITFEENGQNDLTVDAGTYSITEVEVEGYTTTYENCSNVSVANGATVTCTVTNNDVGDIDGDGVGDETDNCPAVANADQLDTDDDGIGNACDTDDDGDGQTDADETSCGSNPLDIESKSTDTDNDNIPDCVDTDDDNDTILDDPDNCNLIANTDQADNDQDGIGNVCDDTPDGNGGGGNETPVPAKLTVTKVVINNNGGTKQALDFPLFVNSTSVTSGVQTNFNPGAYTVSETQQQGYSLLSITGDCSSDGTITLVAGDVKRTV